jgi:hypothetical protein
MRTQLNHIHAKPILRILIILGILVQTTFTFNACSSDSNDDQTPPPAGGGGISDWLSDWQKERLKYYDPDDSMERCKNGTVEFNYDEDKLENLWFNPMTHYCIFSITAGLVVKAIERCGNGYIADDWTRCKNGVVEERCEKCEDREVWYNPKTHYEYNREIKVKEPCGSEYYDPDYQRCQNGVVEESCGMPPPFPGMMEWYNPKTHYCRRDYDTETHFFTYTVEPQERCGNLGKYMGEDPGYERCNNGVYEEKCGDIMSDTWYNSITQSCDYNTGEVRNKVRCGN